MRDILGITCETLNTAKYILNSGEIYMPKEFYRRAEHYDEALKGEDRPVWNEKKAQRMKQNWESSTEIYADLEDFVAGILVKYDINGPLRAVYHSFAKKAFKQFVKGTASAKALDALADYWVKVYKADKRVLGEILGYIKKRYSTGARR